MTDLPRYREWAPSAFDAKGLNLPQHQDWFVTLMHTRDSGHLDESNWNVFLGMLADAGCAEGSDDEDTGDYLIARFGHWGPGWFEVVLVRPDSPAEEVARKAIARMENYPILDEDDFSNREWEAAQECWANLRLRERIRLCAKARVSIFAARRDGIPQEDNGSIYEYCRGE